MLLTCVKDGNGILFLVAHKPKKDIMYSLTFLFLQDFFLVGIKKKRHKNTVKVLDRNQIFPMDDNLKYA
jgi:hypothetical protein